MSDNDPLVQPNYEYAANRIVNNPEIWQKIRHELGLSRSATYRLRSRLKKDIYKVLQIIKIVNAPD